MVDSVILREMAFLSERMKHCLMVRLRRMMFEFRVSVGLEMFLNDIRSLGKMNRSFGEV